MKLFFQLENSDTDELKKKRFVPVNLTRSKQVITVTVPEASKKTARSYCGLRGFFEGEYTNSNATRIYKTSFNCDKAKTKIELAICQTSKLAHADIVLSKLYFQLKSKRIDNIVKQQKEWIKDRDTCSESLDLKKCLLDKYNFRILALQQKSLRSDQEKTNTNVPYNYDYLLFLLKRPDSNPYDIHKGNVEELFFWYEKLTHWVINQNLSFITKQMITKKNYYTQFTRIGSMLCV